MKTVGIVGGTGITAGELIDLVLIHPHLHLKWVYSSSRPHVRITDIHPQLIGRTSLKFVGEIDKNIDVLFLCLGHGHSKTFLDKNYFDDHVFIIDLSNEFRLPGHTKYHNRDFIYGLPELNASSIAKAHAIANPGCFATGIQLALLPLSNNHLLKNDVHIHSITGSTGAGIRPQATTHFSWRDNNISWYKPFVHQHLDEIKRHIKLSQGAQIHMIPLRGDFTRGIFTTCYLKSDLSESDVYDLYDAFYQSHPFTHLSKNEVHLKQVINTNNCVIHLHQYQQTLLITSILDNLLKGASSQAIENLNLMLQLDPATGLNLKPSVY
ncbi:MAG: N-acetyl-gamma-glutamyl-phosphate reductase [Flavobacteriaceae bacterium]|nr:N-acetyl-gamma-glutamyl-phosphate reductase [Flavobacteriaceae bacterium]